ncbi:MAG: type IV toxin-antitoxin system AbiEi family antitoxin [Bacteroidia bacterium]|jgi:predicted transcriptional regulator of viral defense system|nr:type IV toxin-antitoxin system AbiEi family antitoxin [Bacteroidia bacterium]
MQTAQKKSVENWITEQLSKGRYCFTLDNIRKSLSGFSQTAIKFALIRLTEKGKILSFHKGFYIIVVPQYRSKKILPPSLFIDDLMKSLNRPYYVSLLSAAAYHGAGHQQPQEFFVTTVFPALRSTTKKGLRINYSGKMKISSEMYTKVKTESGYMNVSTPLETALDLIHHSASIGGMNRVTEVISELCTQFKTGLFTVKWVKSHPASVVQRLGYLLEEVLEKPRLADALYKTLVRSKKGIYRIPLKASGKTKGYRSGNRWKVIVNVTIEI